LKDIIATIRRLLCIAVALSIAQIASGVIVVVTNHDDKIEKHGGWVEAETSTRLYLRLANGGRGIFQKKKIVRIEPACEAKEIEALRPNSPGGYFRVGERLVKAKEDPETREMGRRLLLISAHLAPDRYYEKTYALLAATSRDDAEKASYIFRLLVAKPGDAELAKQYMALKPGLHKARARELRALLSAIQYPGSKAHILAIRVRTLRTLPARTLATNLTTFLEQSAKHSGKACPKCNGSSWATCPQCDGIGATRCRTCKGRGYEKEKQSPAASRKPRRSRSSPRVSNIVCAACGSSGQVKCADCTGVGIVPCCLLKSTGEGLGALASVEKQIIANLKTPENGYPWMKTPLFGTRTFEPDIDYAKTIFREGKWDRPVP
jgi:hypothetical protein